MGFLQQDTQNIIVDAVLTDTGRQKLAAGTFNVIKWAAGDDEVDYGMIVRYGRTVGQEKIEKNTPVFEAITKGSLAQTYKIVSLPDPNRYTMTQVSATGTGFNGSTLALGTGNTRTRTVTVTQTLTGGENIPQELVDNQFMILCDDRFITIAGSTPVIDRTRMATYIVTRNGALSSQGGAAVSFDVISKSITDAQFQIYGQPGNKNLIRTIVRVTGMSSGTVFEFVAEITKNTWYIIN